MKLILDTFTCNNLTNRATVFFIVIQSYYSSLVDNPVKEKLENVDEEKNDVSWEQIWQDHWATICTEEYNRFMSRNFENEEVQSEASAGDDTKNDEIPAVSQEFEKNLTISDEQDRCSKGVTNWLKRINPTADASQSNLSTVSNVSFIPYFCLLVFWSL